MQLYVLSGTTIVQVGHCLVDGLHNISNSGSGCHVDGVQVVIGTNEDNVCVGWVGNTCVLGQIGGSLQ